MTMTYKKFAGFLENIEDDYYNLYLDLEIENAVTLRELEVRAKLLTDFYRNMKKMPPEDQVHTDYIGTFRDIKEMALTYSIDEKYYPKIAKDNQAILERMEQLLTQLEANQQNPDKKPVTPEQTKKPAAAQGSGSPHVMRFIAKHGDTFTQESIQSEQEKGREKLRSRSPLKK